MNSTQVCIIISFLAFSLLPLKTFSFPHSTATTSETTIQVLIPNHSLDGLVFEDFNYNGTEESGEPGLLGIEVNVYDCNNNLVGTTTTDTNGEWDITSGILAGAKYRVEFVLPSNIAAWASPTQTGSDNGTLVQFMEAGEYVHLGVASPVDYCQENPLLAVPCYVNGDPTGGGTAGAIDWLVYFRNDNEGEVGEAGHTPPEIKVGGTMIGATWGVSYHRQTQTVLASAVMKRHSGFGQNGTGAIYQINAAGTPSLFVDLNSYINVNTGADTRGGDANNTLPNNFNVANRDINAFQAVGKIGIGDIDLSDDGNFLYAINLHERTLIELEIGNALSAPATATVYNITTAIDNLVSGTAIACDTTADYRPWALKYHRGLLYIGVVCSAEDSQNANDLHAYVLSFDPSNPGGGFSQVIDMAMNYDREPAFQSDVPAQTIAGAWRPWAEDYTDATILPWRGGAHPSPILADLEFDIDGSLILGFLDRFGMQSGYRQLSTDLGDSNTDHQGLSAGDIIRFCNISGSLVQEGQAGCSFNTSPPWTNPGNFVPQGEFYGNDEYFTTITNPSHGHPETGLGSLALLPGNGEVTVGVFDPFALRSGGIAWWDNTNGDVNKEYELYESVDGDGSFSKAVGLGDLEYMCNAAPIEIGNYVWNDADGDGIQGACESPIEDVILTLYNSTCEIVAIDTTDTNGNYAFNETKLTEYTAQTDTVLASNTTYYIVISGAVGGNWSTTNNELTIGSNQYDITKTKEGAKEQIDSDGELGTVASACSSLTEDYIFATLTTGNAGEVDHSFDFGLKLFVCPTDKCGRVDVTRD
ncbi:MAG: SdrD B-like domain-containing protein [Chitinophagales bacterium]